MPAISTTLALVGIGLAGAGTATSVVGQVKAGNAASRQAQANAAIAEQNAQNAVADAAIAESQQREKDRHILARGRALIGASGVQPEGSPALVMAENARQAEMDALIIRRGGKLEAQSARAEGAAQLAAGKAAKTASRYGAGSTLLTGGYGILKEVAKL